MYCLQCIQRLRGITFNGMNGLMAHSPKRIFRSKTKKAQAVTAELWLSFQVWPKSQPNSRGGKLMNFLRINAVSYDELLYVVLKTAQ